jgi:hypothetical protein
MSQIKDFYILSLHKEIQSIDKELKRLSQMAKKLREQKKKHQTIILNYMDKIGIDKWEKYDASKLNPEKKTRKKAVEKKKDAIELFRRIGVPQPETFYNEFKQTQK